MATCAFVRTNMNIAQSGTGDPCTHLVLTKAELEQLYVDIGTDTDFLTLLNNVFAQPDQTQIITAFMAAFTLPLICYLVSYGLGIVVNFFK